MKKFLDDNFLLENPVAEQLYHEFARDLPIIDYHCHLSPADIVENRVFNTITEAWLEGDHYKWRAMRARGVAEQYCTGEASDFDKFMKWAETVPYTLRNPLYHWTHLELRRYFDIPELLTPKSGQSIYKAANEGLRDLSTQQILDKMNVELVCTTDDPIDDLRYHITGADQLNFKLAPTFRADKVLFVEETDWSTYVKELGIVAGITIENLDDLLQALKNRHDYFHANGCRLSDNGLSHMYSEEFTFSEANGVTINLIAGVKVSRKEADQFRTAVLLELGRMNSEKGWTQQYHLGALRNNSSRMMSNLGRDTGFDSIGDGPQATSLSRFFDRLDRENKLAKTIIYNLNPADNAVFASMIGNFNDGSIAGKMQYGSGWWYLDQKDGIEQQINTLSNMGLLSQFVGMLTDSRSFLSFPRHEYFRRILCNLFGRDVVNGQLPDDLTWIGEILKNICYFNAKKYFNIDSGPGRT